MARLAPITPTTVGSYPRPATLVERIPGERASNIRFTTEGDALREAQDDQSGEMLVIRRCRANRVAVRYQLLRLPAASSN